MLLKNIGASYLWHKLLILTRVEVLIILQLKLLRIGVSKEKQKLHI